MNEQKQCPHCGQVINEAADATATPISRDDFKKFLKDRVFRDIPEAPGDIA